MSRIAATFVLALVVTGAVAQVETSTAPGAVLRALDKFSGDVVDITLPAGATAEFGPLRITLTECRYPVGNPSGDAFAGMQILEDGRDLPVFAGWMVASSPALNAVEHPRYDVWVMRCTTS